jgi:hypothetical protein
VGEAAQNGRQSAMWVGAEEPPLEQFVTHDHGRQRVALWREQPLWQASQQRPRQQLQQRATQLQLHFFENWKLSMGAQS